MQRVHTSVNRYIGYIQYVKSLNARKVHVVYLAKERSNVLNEYQKVMLEIIKVIVNVCEERNFKWWADGGTLLGAVRENGFIEWDTDADIIVPREAYNQLRDNPQWFKDPYVLEHFNGTHLKVHDTRTTSRYKDEAIAQDGKPHGINVDIFALDEYIGDVADLSFGYRPNCVWDKEWFSGYRMVKFEDMDIRVPIGAENVLARQYGDWWRPKDGGGSHDNSRVYMSLKKEW